jgi:hypothetical protein
MNLDIAALICREIEQVAPDFGCHVALTGGCLYKDGKRKDLDILFYRIRQVKGIDKEGLFKALEKLGISDISGFGWLHKAKKGKHSIDMFFPEENQGGEYKEWLSRQIEETPTCKTTISDRRIRIHAELPEQ